MIDSKDITDNIKAINERLDNMALDLKKLLEPREPKITIEIDDDLRSELLASTAMQTARIAQMSVAEYSRNGLRDEVKKYQAEPKRV